ncbi:hypothetical protein [Pseudoalteromonas sp. A757]|uniref:hypothetical protein n=1 Tax=Pseudoalteromonas sp. A757 TaxID=2250709 RepID=UPI000FFE8CA6|nr:hypothetical protein [Pseudoalteromonas sp. A757]RXE84174.1 hypothetical protein DRB05_19795 [Pseudoalteromonas sp. A757]
MWPEWEPIRLFFQEYSIWVSFLAVVMCIVVRDKQALRYSSLVALFYILGWLTYDWIMQFDDVKVFRYIYWAFSDIAFMAIIAYWAVKDKMYLWQSILAQIIIIPAPLLQFFRLVDRHFMDLSYSTYLYPTVIPMVNVATLCLAFVPVFTFWKLMQDRKEARLAREHSLTETTS